MREWRPKCDSRLCGRTHTQQSVVLKAPQSGVVVVAAAAEGYCSCSGNERVVLFVCAVGMDSVSRHLVRGLVRYLDSIQG